MLGEPGTLLGVFEDPTFAVSAHRLDAGRAVVFYTDGLTDLPGPAGCTEQHLQDLLARRPFRSARDVVRLLQRDLDERLQSTSRADDVAVLVLVNHSAPTE